ncbi:hypothetical protein G6K88_15725 [Agrobacterium rhizogenes]|uniref:hypothetical protein n=1 Tax=Rhizobium rhizogenes TaxID=359 RepID=UPI001574B0B7|nr:hypothetical protein [Rhizobium rhizogenes]NTI03472.1 hypothetical protein [Rhizobium rhizogenes]NTI10277.1 hypothetical protein [Rhizobium rhizogenes]
MKVPRYSILAIAAFLYSAPQSFSEDLVALTKSPADNDTTFWQLDLTGKADDLVINHVTVNRGCQSQESVPMPISVPFGKSGTFAHYPCDPIEVTIGTNLGDQTFSWDAFTQGGMSIQKFNHLDGTWYFAITNRTDNLKINSVLVNRGNCPGVTKLQTLETPKKDGSLLFGQRYLATTFQCHPLEVTVVTDDGPQTFNWDN